MNFFFPDSQDQVDPSFDFETEERARTRLRHRDDLYAHELFARAPFDGLLVSKAVLEAGRYSLAQRQRMLREGVRRFFRITDPKIQTMGDCGAFAYVREEVPPFSVESVVDYYRTMGFDYGMSVDHIVFGYDPKESNVDQEWRRRQALTLTLAEEFFLEHKRTESKFKPVGVAQGWSPSSYAAAVVKLQKIGYDYVALGGMIGLKTAEIVACLQEIRKISLRDLRLHILGVTRVESFEQLSDLGVTSIDSTSPLRQAFKDSKDNYYALKKKYTALRVPQVDANPQLLRRIKSGRVDQREALRLERQCLEHLLQFDREKVSVERALEVLLEYEALYHDGKSFKSAYRETLTDRPWKACPCEVCTALGIHVVLFRGAERNRRRGFHNLYVFFNQLHGKRSSRSERQAKLEQEEMFAR